MDWCVRVVEISDDDSAIFEYELREFLIGGNFFRGHRRVRMRIKKS